MRRSIPWGWIALAGVVLLAPGLAGRFLVDVLEGVTLLLVLGPLLLTGLGVLAWQLLKPRFVTCEVCGTPSVGAATCLGCGAVLGPQATRSAAPAQEPLASNAVVDVTVTEVSDSDPAKDA